MTRGDLLATRRSTDRRRRRTVVEIVSLAAWFVVFTKLHGLAGQDAAAAGRNADALQAMERAAHLDIELAANRWLIAHPSVIQPAVYVYRLYYVVLAAVLLWLGTRHRDRYPLLRRVLVVITVLVLPVWWALPMSPPRFALDGAVDVVAMNDLFGSGSSTALDNGQNHLSAMPSMHVALSAWCAYAVWTVLRRSRPAGAWLAWLFPALMVAVVIATANHYVLDLVGSAILLAGAIAVARAWPRANGPTIAEANRGEAACGTIGDEGAVQQEGGPDGQHSRHPHLGPRRRPGVGRRLCRRVGCHGAVPPGMDPDG